jgi:CubicO group peptidase (beta-lactamase class C family)
MTTAVRIICFTVLLSAFSFHIAAEDFTNAVQAYLKQQIEAEKINGCIVVGIVDEHGSSVVSYGKLDNGTGQEADGDTVFAIHSASGTFMALLLQEMVERGEMQLDDPVAKYLPKTVKVPGYQGQEITLRHLAKETSGLPWFYDKLDLARTDDPLADFTIEKMDTFVSGCQLTCAPGIKHLHGNVDKGLLGQAMALAAGANFESLMVDQILQPLQMDSTRFTLTSGLKGRLASEHSEFGYKSFSNGILRDDRAGLAGEPGEFIYTQPDLDLGAIKPGFGLFSTANDLLKFLSAFGGLRPCPLTPLIQKSITNLSYAPDIDGMFHTGGGAFGGSVYAAYDKTRRRGVVILSTVNDFGPELGTLLLESEWQPGQRPTANPINHQVYNSYVGQYRRSPDLALGIFAIRHYFPVVPHAAVYISASACLAVLAVLLWCAGRSRRRWLIAGCAVLVCWLLLPLIVWISGRIFCERYQPGINIYHEGNRLIAQATGLNLSPIEELNLAYSWGSRPNPIDVLFPRVPAELLPESETHFFERLSGVPMDFSRDAQGNATGLTMFYRGRMFCYQKVSDEISKVPEPPQRPVAIKLSTGLLDACAGHYEFMPNALFPEGVKMMIWREGDHLIQQTWGQPLIPQAVLMYPESETNFFDKIYAMRTAFIKNDQGEVTNVIYMGCKGKKLKN